MWAKEGRGKGRLRKREEEAVAHSRGMVHRAPTTHQAHLLIH